MYKHDKIKICSKWKNYIFLPNKLGHASSSVYVERSEPTVSQRWRNIFHASSWIHLTIGPSEDWRKLSHLERMAGSFWKNTNRHNSMAISLIIKKERKFLYTVQQLYFYFSNLSSNSSISLPIGKFLGVSPLTAIADPSPQRVDVTKRVPCELDARPKWYVYLYKSLKRSGRVRRSTDTSCKRNCIDLMLSAPFNERQPWTNWALVNRHI